MIKKEIIVEKNQKISKMLQDYGFSFADVNKMLRNKDIKVNKKATKEDILLSIGDNVVFYYSVDMREKKFDIVYESDDVIVVYKSAGIEVEGEKGIEGVIENVFAVHRLDRNTEGLMVFAKNQAAKEKLEIAFKKNLVQKYYYAEVVGNFDTEEKIFKAYLLKDAENSSVKIFANQTKGAVEILTKIKTVKAGTESSLLQIELLTGKTHQIRAHLAYLGHPIIGDGKYGKNEINKKFKQKRQKLACFKLKFQYLGISSLDFKEFVKNPKWLTK